MWQAHGILRLVKNEPDVKVLLRLKMSWRCVRGILKDEFQVPGALPETCSSEMLRCQGADFLTWVAFWSIKSPGFLR